MNINISTLKAPNKNNFAINKNFNTTKLHFKSNTMACEALFQHFLSLPLTLLPKVYMFPVSAIHVVPLALSLLLLYLSPLLFPFLYQPSFSFDSLKSLEKRPST